MRVGIIGAGSMGNAHAVGWQQTDADIVGVFATETEAATDLAERLGGRAYSDIDTLLNDVDIIDICAPTHLHHDLTLKAAKAGKHVLCEKPIALTVSDAERMIAACESAGVRFFVGMVLHFFPEYIAMKRAIADGNIGNPQVIRMTRASYRPQKAADNWFMDQAKSGGMMVDLMIHDFEMARWLAGSEVIRVFAKSIRDTHPDADIDHALVIMRFANGAMAHVEGSWAYPYPLFSVRAEVAGDNGLIEWDSDQSAPISLHQRQSAAPDAGDVALPTSPLTQDPWALEVMHAYDAIVNNTPFRVTPQDALRGLEIAMAARESVRTNAPVQITPREKTS
jgi:myo-inositol 2-dehydrogenase/D-chiro-inositol 1-dehydrogenase